MFHLPSQLDTACPTIWHVKRDCLFPSLEVIDDVTRRGLYSTVFKWMHTSLLSAEYSCFLPSLNYMAKSSKLSIPTFHSSPPHIWTDLNEAKYHTIPTPNEWQFEESGDLDNSNQLLNDFLCSPTSSALILWASWSHEYLVVRYPFLLSPRFSRNTRPVMSSS